MNILEYYVQVYVYIYIYIYVLCIYIYIYTYVSNIESISCKRNRMTFGVLNRFALCTLLSWFKFWWFYRARFLAIEAALTRGMGRRNASSLNLGGFIAQFHGLALAVLNTCDADAAALAYEQCMPSSVISLMAADGFVMQGGPAQVSLWTSCGGQACKSG